MKLKGINIIFCLSFLVVQVSCNKTVEPFENDGYAISFKNVDVNTKQLIEKTGDLTEFSVWGAMMDNQEGIYHNVFEGSRVSKNATGWDYSDHRYWIPNSTYRFFAVAPTLHEVEFDSTDETYNVYYSLPDEFNVSAASFNDLVVASQSVETPDPIEDALNPVDLSFYHPFVKVRLHIFKSDENAGDLMVVKNVAVSGVKNIGTYSYYIGTGISEWALSGSSLISETFNAEIGVESNDEDWLNLEFYALPQYISSGQVNVSISYQYTEPGQTAKDLTYNAPVPQTDIWRANKIVTYNAELSEEHKIRFNTPSVETWGEQGSGIVIIQ